VAVGLSLSRVVMTFICAFYSAGCFYRFLSSFRLSDGGVIRSIILTFLLLFLLPVTALVEGGHCFVAALMMLSPSTGGSSKGKAVSGGKKKQQQQQLEVPFASPSAHA